MKLNDKLFSVVAQYVKLRCGSILIAPPTDLTLAGYANNDVTNLFWRKLIKEEGMRLIKRLIKRYEKTNRGRKYSRNRGKKKEDTIYSLSVC